MRPSLALLRTSAVLGLALLAALPCPATASICSAQVLAKTTGWGGAGDVTGEVQAPPSFRYRPSEAEFLCVGVPNGEGGTRWYPFERNAGRFVSVQVVLLKSSRGDPSTGGGSRGRHDVARGRVRPDTPPEVRVCAVDVGGDTSAGTVVRPQRRAE